MVRWRCIHTQQLYASGKYAIYLFICLLLLVRAGRCDKNDGIAILLYNTQYVFKYLYVSANRLVPKTFRKNNFLQTEKDKKKNFYSFEVWEQNQFVIAKFCIYVFLNITVFPKSVSWHILPRYQYNIDVPPFRKVYTNVSCSRQEFHQTTTIPIFISTCLLI